MGDESEDGKAVGVVGGYSPDLATAIHGRMDGIYFRDTTSDQAILAGFKAPPDFYGWTIANDRRFVTAENDKVFRIWDLSRTPAQITDFPLDKDSQADRFVLGPDGKTLITEDMPLIPKGPMETLNIVDVSSHKVRFSLHSNGSIHAGFSDDGRYLFATFITGEAPDRLTWTRRTRIWDLSTGKPIGPMIDMTDASSATTLFGERILALVSEFGPDRFLDLQTLRLVGAPINVPSSFGAGPGFRGPAAYSIDMSHILHRYAVNPVLSLTDKALITKACRQWGAKGQMKLTPFEVTSARAWFAADPCG